MVLKIGIAMNHIPNGHFQWSLCTTPAQLEDVVSIYTIVPTSATEWKVYDGLAFLSDSATFAGVLLLPSTTPASMASSILTPPTTTHAHQNDPDSLLEANISDFIRESCPPVNHQDFTIAGPPRGRWASDVWVMRALILLNMAGLVHLPCEEDELYLRVLERAEALVELFKKPGGPYAGEFPVLPL